MAARRNSISNLTSFLGFESELQMNPAPFHLESFNASYSVCYGLRQNKIVKVGENSGLVLRRLWIKVYEIWGQCRRPFVLSNTLARLSSLSRYSPLLIWNGNRRSLCSVEVIQHRWYMCRDGELYSSVTVSADHHVPPVSVHQLIQQSSAEAGWDNTVVGGGVLSSTQASKVLCRLAHEVDRYSTNCNCQNNQLCSLLSSLTLFRSFSLCIV